MKKIIFPCLAAILFFACNNHSNGPDVSDIKVEIPIERFDQQFFSVDTIAPAKSIADMQVKFKSLMPVYLENILGLNDFTVNPGISRFIRLNKFIADSVNKIFNNTDDIKKDFENAPANCFPFLSYTEKCSIISRL